MKNILSIDVESWVHFYLDALKIKDEVSSSERKTMDGGHLPFAIHQLLDLLARYRQRATFFIVAEIYDWYPEVIRAIENQGHEIGYHTHNHELLRTSEVLAAQLEKSERFLNDFYPIGFRAPLIYMPEGGMAELKQRNFRYSSSTYDAHHISSVDGIDEIPVTSLMFRQGGFSNRLPKNLTLRLLSSTIPFGSGLFIALTGGLISNIIKYVNQKGVPAIIFLHPWQLYRNDAMNRQMKNFSFVAKLIRKNPFCLPYLKCVLPQLERLLQQYEFTSFKNYFYE